MMKVEWRQTPFIQLTVAGAAQVGRWAVAQIALLLPVELRHVNHAASTNGRILGGKTTCPFLTQVQFGVLNPQAFWVGGAFVGYGFPTPTKSEKLCRGEVCAAWEVY
jgi:hypothetical protein